MTPGSPGQIRPFSEDDRRFLIEIVGRLVPERTASPREPGAIARFLNEQASGKRPYAEGTELFIAVDEAGQRLGLLGIRQDEDYFSGHPRAYVELLAVVEAATGQGIGRALMNFAERWARERRCHEVALDAFADNDGALAFYAQVGFQPDHIRLSKPLLQPAE
jgi:GNAT superfamily N-acetyltransferase